MGAARMALMIGWPDGTVLESDTPEHLMAEIMGVQWHEYTADEMRQVLSDRAWKWSTSTIDPGLPLPRFFRKLEDAGMCVILRWEWEEVDD